LKGLAVTQGQEALPALLAAMKGNELKLQGVAIRLTSEIPGPEITSALTGELPKLSATAQVQVLAGLADRGDKSAKEAVVTATKIEGRPEVRAAALAALAKLGDASSVMLLADTAAASKDPEQASARESLAALRGPDVDQTIMSNIGKTGPKVKVELIRAVGERGITAAVATLLDSAKDDNGQVRRESLRALRETAGLAEIPALIDLLVTAKSSSDRDEAERALALTLKRNENAGIGGVLNAYRATSESEVRASLLQTLGDVGQDGMSTLKAALKDSNADVARAAIRALSSWPDAAPADDLLGVAKDSANDTHQILALRGYIKLITLPSSRSAVLTVAMLKEAMSAAKQPEEKKAILGALPQFSCPEALKLAEAAVENAAVAQEAKIAVERIKNSLARN
jgi:HEAT repeat protein